MSEQQKSTRADYRFFHRLRVRWSEVDIQKIVFNAHYLMYFDTAIADYWRALAMPYEDAMHMLGGDMYLKKAGIEFDASARMDDQLDIGLRCDRIGNSSMRFEGAIFRGDKRLVTGELLYVYADPATQTSRPVPQPLRALMEGYEAGQEMLEIRCGDWAQMRHSAAPLRTRVFVEEQGVPAEMEWDEDDARSLHAVAFNRLGQAVATGRLLPSQDRVARVGRMAVHPVLRGAGLGRQVLRVLCEAAAARGDRSVNLHAQRSAEAFYRRLGFQPQGEGFDEAGIAHVEMNAPLPL